MSNIHVGVTRVSVNPLALDWWAVALRGVLAIVIGMFALLMPAATIAGLVIFFAAYMLFDGVLAIVAAVRAIRRHGHWSMLLIEGILDLAAATVAISWPLMTAIILVYLLAGWAIATGLFMLIATFRHPSHQGQWAMRIAAIVSLLWGLLLLFAPLLGALVLTWWIAAYALFFGGALLAMAWRLRKVHTHHKDGLLRGM
jgi:uncharacterized membrane protein HdeD (DUF308 family)